MTASEVSENIRILSLIDCNKVVWNYMKCFNIQKIVNYNSVSLSLYFLVCSVYSCTLKRFVMNKFLKKFCTFLCKNCTSFNEAWSLAIVCMHFVSNIFAFWQVEQFCIFCCPCFISNHYMARHMHYVVMPLNCNPACYPDLCSGLES